MFFRGRKSRTVLSIGVFVATAALVVSACGSSTSDSSGDSGTPSDTQQTGDNSDAADDTGDAQDSDEEVSGAITVWLMEGGISKEAQEGLVTDFESQYDVDVNIETQQWADIVTKLTTALATNNPPDVVVIGNTNVALFAASGALADLSQYENDFYAHDTWSSAVGDPAYWDGKLFAVPYTTSPWQVIYNKAMWADAGITEPPSTYDELKKDLDAIKAANPEPNFSAMELQGYLWYAGLSWVVDYGGGLAHLGDDGQWVADIDSPESVAGLEEFQRFQNEYAAVATRSMRPGDQDAGVSFANGQTASFIGKAGARNTIVQSNPDIEDDLGSFSLPSMNHSGELAPMFSGGTNLAVSAGSQNPAAAVKFVQFATSEDIQAKYMVEMSANLPTSVELADKLAPSASDWERPSYAALANSIVVPAAPGWVTIEGDASIPGLFNQISEGAGSVQDLATNFAEHLTEALNAS